MLNVRLHLVLGFVLLSLVSASPGRAATLFAAPAPARGVKTSSGWLRTGEALEQKGQYVEAGDAYRKALEAMSQSTQKANEGAKAARLSAEAHLSAFEQDLDVVHLQAAMDVLSLWLTLTGPQSQASMLHELERMRSRVLTVREALGAADTAMAAGDTKKAVGHYGDAVDALESHGYEWPLEARIVVRASAACVAAYDRGEKTAAHVQTHRPGLEAVRALLVEWKGKRPTDDASEQGPAVEQALAEVEARLAEAKQVEADAAEAERLAAEKAVDDENKRREAERLAAEIRRREDERKAAEAHKKRTLAIGLLAGGVVAAGGGAALVGEGLVGDRVFKNTLADRRREAQGLSMEGRRMFEADAALRTAENRRRTLGMTIGGSVLAAGGLAMAVYGIVKLAQGRPARGSTQRARIHPGPFLVTVEF